MSRLSSFLRTILLLCLYSTLSFGFCSRQCPPVRNWSKKSSLDLGWTRNNEQFYLNNNKVNNLIRQRTCLVSGTWGSSSGSCCYSSTSSSSISKRSSGHWMAKSDAWSNETWSSDGAWQGLLHDGEDDFDGNANDNQLDDEFDEEEEDDDEDEDHDDGEDDDDEHDGHDESLSLEERYEFMAWSNAVEDAILAVERKRTALQSELTKAQGIEETITRAQLLVSNLYLFTPGVTSAIVTDWEQDGKEVELKLDPKYESASAEADALFAQARKVKRGSVVVAELLDETASAWDLLQEARMDLESAVTKQPATSTSSHSEDDHDVQKHDIAMDEMISIDKGRFFLIQDKLKRIAERTNLTIPTAVSIQLLQQNDGGPPKRQSKRSQRSGRKKPRLGSPASNIRKFVSPGGCTILVGRNRRGNEHLSLTIARGNDIWMHSRGCPGAHVVIQNRRGGPTPTSECLQLGADLAIFYSDFRTERKAPVLAAEPKHLLKPRGAPLGAIKVRQEWKTFVGHPDDVPEECKEAREESGQSDDYRSSDKAKHRRRTQKAVAEEASKQHQKRRQQHQKRRKQQQENQVQ